MCVTDEQIQRIYDRLDDIEKSLETRLRALEIWQAYQTGRLTALALFFSALGAAVVGAVGFFLRHFKTFVAVALVSALTLLSGCAVAVKPDAKYGISQTASYVATASAYVDEASVSASAAKRGLEKIKAAYGELGGTDCGAATPALRRIEEGRAEAAAQLERVTVKLALAKEEQVRTETALQETQSKIDSLEVYNTSLAKDRDAAVQHVDALKRSNDTLAGRLSRLVLVIAGFAAWLAWIITRGFGLKALPLPYCYVWPGAVAAAAGVATFGYLRYYL